MATTLHAKEYLVSHSFILLFEQTLEWRLEIMKMLRDIVMVGLVGVALVGCGSNTEDNAMQKANQVKDQSNNYQDDMYGDKYYNTNMDSRMNISEEAAKKITELDEVGQAHVVVVESDAYVAVMLKEDNKEELYEDLKKKISDEVMKTDSNINKVYVSSNPEFIDHMEDYSERLQKGEPLKGLYDEFKGMAERIFPEAYRK